MTDQDIAWQLMELLNIRKKNNNNYSSLEKVALFNQSNPSNKSKFNLTKGSIPSNTNDCIITKY